MLIHIFNKNTSLPQVRFLSSLGHDKSWHEGWKIPALLLARQQKFEENWILIWYFWTFYEKYVIQVQSVLLIFQLILVFRPALLLEELFITDLSVLTKFLKTFFFWSLEILDFDSFETCLLLFAESVDLKFLYNLFSLIKYFINIDILLCCHLVLFPQDKTDLSATITHENLTKSFLIIFQHIT